MNEYFENIEYIDVIDSTNKELKKDKYNTYNNYVLIANQQTNGTGRLTRTFVSNKDAGLYMSVRIKPQVSIKQLNNLTCVVAAIVSNSIEKQIKRLVDIKWVNDIYINNFKIAGILVESKINFNTNNFEYLIIGIGINLYQQEFDADLSKTASNIEKETRIKISKEQLIKDILFDLSIYLKDYNSEEYMKQYIARSFLIGRNIKLQTSNELIECIVEDINYNGELIIKHNNCIKTINSAEVIKTCL